MKVKCTGYKQKEKHFTIGKIYEVSTNGEIRCDTGYIYGSEETPEKMIEWLSRWYSFEVVPDVDRCELHITCNDGKTTNAVYKVNGKVEKQSKAVCCPSDTFNFNTGAELTINRILYSTDFKPISADKIASGTLPTCQPIAPQEDKPTNKFKCTWTSGGANFIVGKVYELRSDKSVIGEDGVVWSKYNGMTAIERLTDWNWYKFEPYTEPEKEPEPVYLNMKVVCTKSTKCYHTVGVGYEIKDGFINYDGGSGAYNGKPITTLEEFNERQPDKFIPYLGEA